MSPTGLFPVAASILRTVQEKYVLMMTQVTWPVAQNYCRVMYSDLATVASATDWLILNQIAERKGLATSALVGLYNDIDSWRWSLNELPLKSVSYSKWASNEPNNQFGKQSCGIIDQNKFWRDAQCTDKRPFICYDAESIN